MYSVLPLSLFTFKLAKLVHLYRVRVGANLRQTHRRGDRRSGADAHHRHGGDQGPGHQERAVLPHAQAGRPDRGLWHALAAAREETLMMIGPVGLGLGGGAHHSSDHARGTAAGPDRLAWIIVLCIQSVPVRLLAHRLARQRLPAAGAPARHALPPDEFSGQACGPQTRQAGGGPGGLSVRQGRLRAIVSMLTAVAAFSGMDTLLKLLSASYPPMQVAVLRGACLAAVHAAADRWSPAAGARSCRGAGPCTCCAARSRWWCSAASSIAVRDAFTRQRLRGVPVGPAAS